LKRLTWISGFSPRISKDYKYSLSIFWEWWAGWGASF